ncbi:hypothetical protein [Limimaricola cinnabarinus]|uniref:hypothetical protein n=1 Tax=Limimaricola cinnabarinus TaxID=1125964 RepID=UPI0013A66BEF|nr:hypothetical protein [Limimaricola cinnabarinus]
MSEKGQEAKSASEETPVSEGEELLEPPSDVDLHRLCWEPDDFDNGEPTTAAFPRSDLSGRYLSVDRMDTLVPQAVRSIAAQQRENAQSESNDFDREDAMSLILDCQSIRVAVDRDGGRPFAVKPQWLEENPAHCGVHNVSGKKGKGYVNHLRSLLLLRVIRVARTEDILGEREDAAHSSDSPSS